MPVAYAQFPKAKVQKPEKLGLEFSKPAGFYNSTLSIELFSPGSEIRYTTDGSFPGKSAPIYTAPVALTKTTVIRAVALQDGRRSEIKSNTFFINEPQTKLPVVSISVTPEALFDPFTGLYMKGPRVVDSLEKKPGANFWSRDEIIINCEIFEADSFCVYSSLAGLRLFGGISRVFPQKSMTIVARDRYGDKRIKHPIFGKEGLDKFKFLVLRNSGSDFGRSHFRDAFMTQLVKHWNMEMQDHRPAHVYINGTYWGLYNIREKINRYFISHHTGVHKDSIDLIEHMLTRKRGSTWHYRNLLDFLDQNDLSQPENFAYLQTQMDVENFLNYQIAQIYFDNRDAGGNVKFWRPRSETGRWRWILFDTDWGFGLHDPQAYQFNTLAFHTEANGPSWPNPPWSTFILRKLLENEDFRQAFVLGFCDQLNTSFESERVLAHIDQAYQAIQEEMPRHFERWRLKPEVWHREIDKMKHFAKVRPGFVRQHLKEYFNLGSEIVVNLHVTSGGRVRLNNNIDLEDTNFKGHYYAGMELSFEATPRYGFRFSHWESPFGKSKKRRIRHRLAENGNVDLKAVFEPYVHPLAGKLMINEISGNNKKSQDWLELYNASEEPVNLLGWELTDFKNSYTLPPVKIAPNGFLILCEDTAAFRTQFSRTIPCAGNFDFGINKRKEALGLFSSDGAFVDSLAYELLPIDTTFTLGLLLPTVDNARPENWEVSLGSGTPSAPNPFFVASRIKAQQELWTRIGAAAGLSLVFFILVLVRRQRPEVRGRARD